ncbi:MAG: hypothetical protein OHK0048_23150 [Rhodoferax sp.]
MLLAATTLGVALVFVGLGLWPLVDRLAHQQLEAALDRVRNGLTQSFVPPQRMLVVAEGLLDGQAPDLANPEPFNRYFKPLLRAVPIVTSVVAATGDGRGYLLLNLEQGWRNRISDVQRWGDRRHILIDQTADGRVVQTVETKVYDPRLRPWYQGAMALADPDTVYWTEPYTFFTTGDPGITASRQIRMRDGSTLVLGFDLKLRDLSRATQGARVSAHGLALVLDQHERVLALPVAPPGIKDDAWLKNALQPAVSLPLPMLAPALQTWRAQDRPHGGVLTVDVAGQHWLASVRPFALGHQQLWMMVLAPASDFAPQWTRIGLGLALALGLLLVFALALTRAGSARLARPLEQLERNSAHIARWISEGRSGAIEPVRSRVRELQLLAHSQAQMWVLLQQRQAELDARGRDLAQQVAALQRTEAQLQRQNERLQAVIAHFPGGIMVVDADLRVVAYNATWQRLLALPDALLARPVIHYADIVRHQAQQEGVSPADLDAEIQRRIDAARADRPHRAQRTLASGRTVDLQSVPLPGGGFVTVYADVTDALQHQQALERMAHFDALTGLPNRVLLADRLRQAMAQAQRRDQPLVLAYLDLDGFKPINDQYGHAMGDRLLVTLARNMAQTLREGDTLARLGGDEFVVIFVDVPDVSACAPMLLRLLTVVEQPVRIDGVRLEVSVSIGVSFYPQGQDVDADQLLRQADQAMYQAKQAGKNRFSIFDTALEISQRGELARIERLRQALLQREFVLFYQPKVNLRTGDVVGAEALIRWQHPEHGLLAPGQFLPLIENHPLAVSLGQWVIETALTQMQAWRAQGLRLPVSVNVGARQLQQSDFVAQLQATLQGHPELADDLSLEVLETSALEDVHHGIEVMRQCQTLGVRFALDDFGTGYSSLAYLKRLPVALIKIDQGFVRDMLDDPDDLSILVSVLDLARAFDRGVIAEGVETAEHARMLLRLGCDLAQGYGIARPMASEHIPAWVRQWRPDPAWAALQPVSRRHQPILFACVELRAWARALDAHLDDPARPAPQPLAVEWARRLLTDGLSAQASEIVTRHIEPLLRELQAQASQCVASAQRGPRDAAQAERAALLSQIQALYDQLLALLPAPVGALGAPTQS